MESKTNDKFIAMLGFSRKSGKVVFGLDNLKKMRNTKLLAVSDTASDNLRRGMETLATERAIPLVYAKALEMTVGNNVKALGFTDANMVKAVIDYIETGTTEYSVNNGQPR